MSHFRENEARSDAAANLACSICGTLNAHGAEFCRCCGVSITRSSEAVAPLERGGFCETCQCSHATPARFCDQCGGKLPGYVRPPDASSRNERKITSAEANGVAETKAVTAQPKVDRAFEPSVQPAERRSSKAYYLLVPAICAATAGAMYINGYRVTRADAAWPSTLQGAVSLPAAGPYPAPAVLPAAENEATEERAGTDGAPMGPAQSEADIGADVGNDAPAADPPAPLAAEPPRRLAALQRIIPGEAYEEPVSAIRELPAMPIHDFRSVVQLDPAGK